MSIQPPPEGMITVEEFASRKGLAPDKVMNLPQVMRSTIKADRAIKIATTFRPATC